MLVSGVRDNSVQAVGTCVHGDILLFPSSCTNRLIESSLGSVATKLNFFIHNLAQMKFTGSDDRLTLSFAPRTHTLQRSGRLSDVFLCRQEKVFHPNKGYVSVVFSGPSRSPVPPASWVQFLHIHTAGLEWAGIPCSEQSQTISLCLAQVACLESGSRMGWLCPLSQGLVKHVQEIFAFRFLHTYIHISSASPLEIILPSSFWKVYLCPLPPTPHTLQFLYLPTSLAEGVAGVL